ncbi:MAG: hypothetical protein AVDCRST_MAG79-33, partial [uncultured Thermoleophilia bacterium]
ERPGRSLPRRLERARPGGVRARVHGRPALRGPVRRRAARGRRGARGARGPAVGGVPGRPRRGGRGAPARRRVRRDPREGARDEHGRARRPAAHQALRGGPGHRLRRGARKPAVPRARLLRPLRRGGAARAPPAPRHARGQGPARPARLRPRAAPV